MSAATSARTHQGPAGDGRSALTPCRIRLFAGGRDSRICLSTESTDGTRHYRQFQLELIGYREDLREVQVHLYVSQLLTEQECQQADLDLESRREVDTNFLVGLFDFPMIDNTRLSGGERTSVSLTALNPSVLSIALAYFPASRASLKDKPLVREVIREWSESAAAAPDESRTSVRRWEL